MTTRKTSTSPSRNWGTWPRPEPGNTAFCVKSAQAVGDALTVAMFAPGEFVKISGKSIGKGYAGAMKRWNFAGEKASHGTEKTHRSAGGIGNNTEPGKVWKNKKMAGHMGARNVTVSSIMIVDVRPEENLILVKGPVPGPVNGLVMVRKY